MKKKNINFISSKDKVFSETLSTNRSKSLKAPLTGKRVSNLQERITAHHEAGHAVAYYLFGEELAYVTIVPDVKKGSLGLTQPLVGSFNTSLKFNCPPFIEGRLAFEREVIVSMAGHVAEIKYRHRRNKLAAVLSLLDVINTAKLYTDNYPIDDGDFNHIDLFFKRLEKLNQSGMLLKEDEHICYFQWLWLRTINMLTAAECWSATEAVATELLRRKKISGKEVKKIIAANIPSRLKHSSLNLTGKQMAVLMMEDSSLALKK